MFMPVMKSNETLIANDEIQYVESSGDENYVRREHVQLY